MESIKQALIGSKWQTPIERLRKLKLDSKEYTNVKQVQVLVKTKVMVSSTLQRYFKAMKKMDISPQLIIKQAIFFHVYLESSNTVLEEDAIGFMNYLINQCDGLVKLYSDDEVIEGCQVTINKITYTRTQETTQENEPFYCKEIFLISKIVKPYIRYIFKLVSIFDDYKGIEGREMQSCFVWQLINLLRNVTAFTNNFIMIGRYFMKEYGMLVVSLTQAISKDLFRYMDYLKRYIREQNYILSCSSNQVEVKEFINILNEMSSLNEDLVHIYLGKYFYHQLKGIPQPSWVNTSSNQFDTIFKIANRYEEESKACQEGHQKKGMGDHIQETLQQKDILTIQTSQSV